VHAKSRKIDPLPLIRKISAQVQPPLVRSEKNMNLEKFEILCAKKCGRPHLKKPLSPRWTTPLTPSYRTNLTTIRLKKSQVLLYVHYPYTTVTYLLFFLQN